MTSVLEKDYLRADRPYSQKELNDIRQINKKTLYLGNVKARHAKCGHEYLTKMNGRKEKDIISLGVPDCGNCSVCWKLNKTPRHLRNRARELITEYIDRFCPETERDLTFNDVLVETDFYTWLYREFLLTT